jgi:YD repeat-containing protein
MTASQFYRDGGTLALDAACYIPRRADEQLFEAILGGEFCFVLDSRQVGKSSLMAHAKRRLQEAGVAVAAVELTALGTSSTTQEQWYDALLAKIGAELNMEDALDDFWREHERLAPLHRFIEGLLDVVLKGSDRPVAIFLDEIDVVRSLPFATDELFAGIRELYNRRSRDPSLGRLSFCLIGVAQPTDLIRDPRITPFNIGKRIELTDFTAAEAAPLAQGLPGSPELATRLLARILYWTGGHPYLTQRLCRAVAEDGGVTSPRGVDRVCEGLFFSVRAQDQEHNLKFVSGHLLRAEADRAALLDLYRQVRERHRVSDDPTNPLLAVLRLSGVVRTLEGLLWVRNRIYFRAFDRAWIQANLPDAEIRRQREAFRRGVTRTGATAGILFAIAAGLALFWYDRYFRIHTFYYAAFVKRWGQPVGVHPLTAEQVRHRIYSFKFTQRGRINPVSEVEAVNKNGTCYIFYDTTAFPAFLSPRTIGSGFGQANMSPKETFAFTSTILKNLPCRWDYIYDSNGQIAYEKAYVANEFLWGLVYSPPSNEGSMRYAHYVGADGFPRPWPSSSAEIVKIDYTRDGSEGLLSYYDRDHKPQKGPDGYFGIRQEHDDNGRIRRTIFLGAASEPTPSPIGGYAEERLLDGFGNTMQRILLDAAMHPIALDHRSGDNPAASIVNVRMTYDQYGNMVGFGSQVDGKPFNVEINLDRVFSKDEFVVGITGDFGQTKVNAELDLRDFNLNAVYSHHLDRLGKVAAAWREGENTKRFTLDFSSATGEITVFNTTGNVVPIQGCHRTRSKIDFEALRVLEEACLDQKGQPAIGENGFSLERSKYNGQGQKIEWSYFDTKGLPTIDKRDGTHRATFRYDARGNKIEWAYFDTEGRPTIDKTDGAHRMTARYDERGNKIEWAYFDKEGQPTIHRTGGAHRTTARYDERGKQIEVAYFDITNKPTLLAELGIHRTQREFDERGNQIREAYFGVDGRPVRNRKDGYFSATVRYDSAGRITEVASFDAAGQPMNGSTGYQRRTFVYSDAGIKSEETGYRFDGKMSYASEHLRFDGRGNEIEKTFFDSLGMPSLHDDGYHKITTRYDERGRKCEIAYFDTRGNPVRHKGGGERQTAAYDDGGVPFEVTEHGLDGSEGVGVTSKRYRFKGGKLLVDIAFFDAQGKSARGTEGYERKTITYDNDGRMVEESYYGLSGEEGVVSVRYKFDKQQRQVEEAWFDTNGKAVRARLGSPLGYSVRKTEYDADGKERGFVMTGFDPGEWGYSSMFWGSEHAQCFDAGGHSVATELLVTRVIPSGQADVLGLKAGDVLIRYAGMPLHGDASAFIRRRESEAENGPAQGLWVRRYGQELRLQVKPGKLGIHLQDRGIAVSQVVDVRQTKRKAASGVR